MVKHDWLAAASFERTDELVGAINTLSIHAKLALAGVEEAPDGERVRQARTALIAFLDALAAVVREVESDRDGALVGADPRLGALAARYLAARGRWPQRAEFYALSFDELRDLVRSERREDLPAVVSCLRGLRALLEQHAHEDVTGILGAR